jgi:hypothetical protein
MDYADDLLVPVSRGREVSDVVSLERVYGLQSVGFLIEPKQDGGQFSSVDEQISRAYQSDAGTRED